MKRYRIKYKVGGESYVRMLTGTSLLSCLNMFLVNNPGVSVFECLEV